MIELMLSGIQNFFIQKNNTNLIIDCIYFYSIIIKQYQGETQREKENIKDKEERLKGKESERGKSKKLLEQVIL